VDPLHEKYFGQPAEQSRLALKRFLSPSGYASRR
jgi:hypothetical protein